MAGSIGDRPLAPDQTDVAEVPAPVAGRRSQQERSASARAKLLGAAIGLICENGFAATTMADIAAAAGLTRGAIQHHFTGRGELVLAILHELERRILTSFDALPTAPQGDMFERAERLIDTLAVLSQSHTYLAAVDIWLSTRADDELREDIRRAMARSWESYGLLWQHRLGDLVPPAAIAECRLVVVNVLRGLVLSRIVLPDPATAELAIATCKQMIKQHLQAAIAAREDFGAASRAAPSS